jgi:outer membrane protein
LQYEKEFAQKKSDFEAFRAVAQRDFMRKEAQIYKTVYLEVVDAVRKYAYHYQYSLIMRFNSEKLDASDPQKLIQGLQRPVIYHRSEDDITASVIDYLNRNYTASSSSAKSPSTTRSR